MSNEKGGAFVPTPPVVVDPSQARPGPQEKRRPSSIGWGAGATTSLPVSKYDTCPPLAPPRRGVKEDKEVW